MCRGHDAASRQQRYRAGARRIVRLRSPPRRPRRRFRGDGPGPATQQGFVVNGTPQTEFADLDDYNAAHDPWEREGIRTDPQFLAFDNATGHTHLDDDLRPRDGSPAKGSAVPMPDDIVTTDRQGSALAKRFGGDRGCYWTLKVPAFPGLHFVRSTACPSE